MVPSQISPDIIIWSKNNTTYIRFRWPLADAYFCGLSHSFLCPSKRKQRYRYSWEMWVICGPKLSLGRVARLAYPAWDLAEERTTMPFLARYFLKIDCGHPATLDWDRGRMSDSFWPRRLLGPHLLLLCLDCPHVQLRLEDFCQIISDMIRSCY